jgi:uncharacterized RDD family membrane protein YckC
VLADFWPRFGGAFIDAFVYFLAAIPSVVIGFALILGGGSAGGGFGSGFAILLGIAVFATASLIPIGLQAKALSQSGQTIGCRVCGLKVVKIATGQYLSFWPAVGRVVFASLASGQVCYLWMLWDDKKQTWHDKILDTVVIEA